MTESLLLQGLRQHADDKDFQKKWQEVKQTAKEKAVARIKQLTGVAVRPDALMDVQVHTLLLHNQLVLSQRELGTAIVRNGFEFLQSSQFLLWSHLRDISPQVILRLLTIFFCVALSSFAL